MYNSRLKSIATLLLIAFSFAFFGAILAEAGDSHKENCSKNVEDKMTRREAISMGCDILKTAVAVVVGYEIITSKHCTVEGCDYETESSTKECNGCDSTTDVHSHCSSDGCSSDGCESCTVH